MVLPAPGKPRDKWTVKENNGWLLVRGIKLPANMTAVVRRSIVQSHHTDSNGPPPVLPSNTPGAQDIRELINLQFQLFACLYATDLKGDKAGNRFDAIVVPFLDLVERIGKSCHPNNKQPISAFR